MEVQLWLLPIPPEAQGPKGVITCSCILSRQQALCSTNGVFFLGHGSKGIKDSDAVTKEHLAPGVRRCLAGRAEPGSETSAQGDKETCAAGQGPATLSSCH